MFRISFVFQLLLIIAQISPRFTHVFPHIEHNGLFEHMFFAFHFISLIKPLMMTENLLEVQYLKS